LHQARGSILIVRGKPLPAVVAAMPFVPNRYKR
jgi:aminomethyltransferase